MIPGEFRVHASSREPLPSVATHDGQPVPHKVALVPFVTGAEPFPAEDADVWVDAPMLLEGLQPGGYFHIVTLSTAGQVAAISCAGHLRVL